jgi:hypothetical protein
MGVKFHRTLSREASPTQQGSQLPAAAHEPRRGAAPTIPSAAFCASACSIANSTTSSTTSIALLPQTRQVDRISIVQALAHRAARPGFGEHIVNRQDHDATVAQRRKRGPLAPGDGARLGVDHALKRRQLFTLFDRSQRGFCGDGDLAWSYMELHGEFVADPRGQPFL